MSIKIMEQARDSMLERKKAVEESVKDAKVILDRAQRELDEINVAVKEQEAAIERVRNPKRASRRVPRPRPQTRHDPSEGTKTYTVWQAVVNHDGTISTGVICSRTGLPASSVKPVLGDLVERGLIERVSDGFFRARLAA